MITEMRHHEWKQAILLFNEVFTGCDVEVTDTVHLKTAHQIEQSKRLADEVFDM